MPCFPYGKRSKRPSSHKTNIVNVVAGKVVEGPNSEQEAHIMTKRTQTVMGATKAM